jgi:hypothetical protein
MWLNGRKTAKRPFTLLPSAFKILPFLDNPPYFHKISQQFHTRSDDRLGKQKLY